MIIAACSGWVNSARIFLKLGAHVNKTNKFGLNALNAHLSSTKTDQLEEMIMLLHAAGEMVNTKKNSVPECLQEKELEMCLQHMCRQTIRKHLIFLNLRVNLFVRIPQLGLPSLLTSYLLYGVSVGDVDINGLTNPQGNASSRGRGLRNFIGRFLSSFVTCSRSISRTNSA